MEVRARNRSRRNRHPGDGRQRSQNGHRNGSADRGVHRRPDRLRHVQGGGQEDGHRCHPPDPETEEWNSRLNRSTFPVRQGRPKHRSPRSVSPKTGGSRATPTPGLQHRQVSFLAGEAVDRMKAKGLALAPGAFGENIVTRGIDWSRAAIGARDRHRHARNWRSPRSAKNATRPAPYSTRSGNASCRRKGSSPGCVKGGIVHAQSSGHHRIR